MIGGDWLVNPVRSPGMVTTAPFSVAEMVWIVEPAKLPLNRRLRPLAPVSTNPFPLISTGAPYNRRSPRFSADGTELSAVDRGACSRDILTLEKAAKASRIASSSSIVSTARGPTAALGPAPCPRRHGETGASAR